MAPGFKGDLDRFIMQNHRVMSQAEISRRTGASTSTVSRRVIALRASGQLDKADRERMQSQGEAPDDRLHAVEELVERLHRELDETAGHGLASVSNAYLKALDERERLREVMGISVDNRFEVNLLEVAQMGAAYYRHDEVHRANPQEVWDAAVESTLRYLADEKAVVLRPDAFPPRGE